MNKPKIPEEFEKAYECQNCGRIFKKIPTFRKGECSQYIQHNFEEIKLSAVTF